MAWDDAPPSPQEMQAPRAASWDAAPPTRDELAPKEDHSLWGAVKAAGHGALSAINTLGEKPLYQIGYERLVKPAVDTYNEHMDAGENVTQSVLAAGAQGLGDIARTGRNMLLPATVPVDVGLDSYDRGNSAGDALHDAANAAVVVGAPAALGAAVRGATGELGQAVGADAVSLGKNLASDVGNKLLPRSLNGLANGETAQILKGRAADAFEGFKPTPAAPAVAPDIHSIQARDIFSGQGKPPMAPATLGAALVKAAAAKGPQQAAIAHYLATQRDPAYAAAQQKKGQ